MSEVRVERLGVSYGATQVVRDVSFELASGRRLAILGPSGCGKSSLLRAVAGLEPLASGRVLIAEQDQVNVPTFRRGLGLMFQDHALFPHLDVSGNIAFGLRMARWSGSESRIRVSQMLELVGLTAYAHAQVSELSGGEQQRVALARTLAPRPRVVLLDEPLGSLDQAMRADLMATMTDVFDATGATAIFVTHDQSEAFALGHEVAVMRAGRFQQLGQPNELWAQPVDAGVARFLGLNNIFPPRTRIFGSHLDRESEIMLRPDLLRLEEVKDEVNDEPGGPRSTGSSVVSGTVVGAAFRGGYSSVTVAVSIAEAEESPDAESELEVWVMGDPPGVGDSVTVSIPEAAVTELGVS